MVPEIGTVVNSDTIVNNVSFILMLIGTEIVVYVYMMYVASVHIFLIENIILRIHIKLRTVVIISKSSSLI